jgi:hypothetical protein
LIELGRRRKDWIPETPIQPLTSASDHHRHGHVAIKADGHYRLSPEKAKNTQDFRVLQRRFCFSCFLL